MATWGDVESYNNMIDELTVFKVEINQVIEMLASAANVCADNMEQDKLSLKASKNVVECCKIYQEAVEKADRLKVGLEEERANIIALLRKMEDMETESY